MIENIPTGVPTPERMPATKETKDRFLDLIKKLATRLNKDGTEFIFSAILPDAREMTGGVPSGPEQIRGGILADLNCHKEIEFEGRSHDQSIHYELFADGRLERTLDMQDPDKPLFGGAKDLNDLILKIARRELPSDIAEDIQRASDDISATEEEMGEINDRLAELTT